MHPNQIPTPLAKTPSGKLRARGLGLQFDGHLGRFNAITDLADVQVGYALCNMEE